jgi:hypothetical protein
MSLYENAVQSKPLYWASVLCCAHKCVYICAHGIRYERAHNTLSNRTDFLCVGVEHTQAAHRSIHPDSPVRYLWDMTKLAIIA